MHHTSRPEIYGTLPARIESRDKNDIYAHLDEQGRYRVKPDFDREGTEPGYGYLWLEAGKVEYGTTATYMRKVKRTMAAGANSLPIESLKQMAMIPLYFDRKLRFSSDINYRVETSYGEEILSGSGTDGYIDKEDNECEY